MLYRKCLTVCVPSSILGLTT